MNKTNGGDEIPAELFQILKDDAVKVLQSICQQIWKTQQWSQDWKRSVFIPVPKKGSAKKCSNYHTIAVISHASKVMLKIVQASFQQYLNCELPDVQVGFRKSRGTRYQTVSICWIIKQARELKIKTKTKTTKQQNKTKQKPNTYFCFIDYYKNFDCVDHNKLWKVLKEIGITDHHIKKQRHYFVDKSPYLVKAMVFLVVLYGCES